MGGAAQLLIAVPRVQHLLHTEEETLLHVAGAAATAAAALRAAATTAQGVPTRDRRGGGGRMKRRLHDVGLRRGRVCRTVTADCLWPIIGSGSGERLGRRHNRRLDPNIRGGQNAADVGDGPIRTGPALEAVCVRYEVEVMLGRQADTLRNV